MKALQDLVRPNIWNIAPYSAPRKHDAGDTTHVQLDANENPYNKSYNRYPDPLQQDLKAALARVKKVPRENIFIGNGSAEVIDLVYRIFCNPQQDNVVAIEPTNSTYSISAKINDVEYRAVQLDEHFRLNADKLLAKCDQHTKVIWICTPNNPTGNNLDQQEIEKLLTAFTGIVVVDEAYSDFSNAELFRTRLGQYPNIIVLNTLSKAWGCAALRIGMAFASEAVIKLFDKVKYPYNIDAPAQQQAIEAINNREDVEKWVTLLVQERGRLMKAFAELPICEKVYPSDANFFLAKMTDAQAVYNYLKDKGIFVRDLGQTVLCDNCLRITIGSKGENSQLLSALRQY